MRQKVSNKSPKHVLQREQAVQLPAQPGWTLVSDVLQLQGSVSLTLVAAREHHARAVCQLGNAVQSLQRWEDLGTKARREFYLHPAAPDPSTSTQSCSSHV